MSVLKSQNILTEDSTQFNPTSHRGKSGLFVPLFPNSKIPLSALHMAKQLVSTHLKFSLVRRMNTVIPNTESASKITRLRLKMAQSIKKVSLVAK